MNGAAACAAVVAVVLAAAAGCSSPPAGTARDPASADPRAVALVDRWIEAAGGAGHWDAVSDVRYTMTTVWYDTATGAELRRRPRRVWIARHTDGFRVRVERTEVEGDYVQVWTGDAAWATLDGRVLPDTSRAVREIPMVAGDLSYWIGLPWKLRDPGVRLDFFDADPHAAGSGVAVSFDPGVGLHPGDRYWYYFGDPASAVPTELHFVEEGRAAETRERTRWGDWRRAGAALYLGRRLHVDADGRPVKALLIGDVAFNTGIADALFRHPSPD